MSRKMYFMLAILVPMVVLFTGPCAVAQEKEPSVEPGAGQSVYRIGGGDVLEITTWKEPDFSREAVLVRLDGKITFPLLDDIQAQGRTPAQVKAEIEEKLAAYIEGPIVTVTVRDPASKKFYILGEVVRTGEYPLVKNLSVLQAFALAGGFTEWASKREIILLRSEGGRDKLFRVNYKNIVKGDDFSQNIKIQPDDTIIVP
jgi:polysaccharide export outer membrane protein